ncbi:hypothetical protein OSL79_11020 [Escherichia coli]|nr:hypothetical protein [Escherichia coli]
MTYLSDIGCLEIHGASLGTFPGWYAFIVIVLTFGLSILIGMSTGMAGATISLPIIFAVAFIAGKAIFADNVMFRRRM